jgi:FSR family fosmidomycin resistance protein-like MFS transporter
MTAATLEHPNTPLRQDVKVMALVGLAHALSHFCHLLLAPLFAVFMKEFDLSFSEVGLLVTVFFVVSGVGQALSGFVVDHFGPRSVLFLALACFVLATLVAATSTGYAGLMLAAVLAGAGNSPFHPVDFTILNQRVSSSRLGYAFSMHGLCGNLGWALAPVWLVGWMNWTGSWRMAYVASAVLVLLVIGVLWWGRAAIHVTPVQRKAGAAGDGKFAFLKLSQVWWCFGFFFFSTMTLAMVQSFGAPILQALYAVSFESATAVVSAYMLASAAGMLAGGWVAARNKQADRVVAACMVLGSVAMGLCSTAWLPPSMTMALLVCTGFAVGIGGPSRDLLIRKATPKEASGRVYGTVYSGLDAGLAIAPVAFGLLMDGRQYNLTLFGGSLALLVGMVMALGIGARLVQR